MRRLSRGGAHNTFEERDDRTTVAIRLEYPSREIRDAVLATGMTDGAGKACDRLRALLTGGGLTCA